jgi:hypothetical protein
MKLGRRVLASLIVVGTVSPAYAIDHFARMNEVLLSFGGDATKQLIEIEDLQNESFAGGGYTLFVYEANGVDQAHFQNLILNPGVMRITIASSSAFTQFGLAVNNSPPHIIMNLSGELPANGTACFRKQGVDLHCMSWGTAVPPPTAPTNGKVAGPAPTDGMSLQRQATGNCAGIGAPTPDAVNTVLPCMDPPTPGTDAGPQPTDGGMGSDGGMNPPKGSDDGCSASGAGIGWLGLVATASFFAFARRSRRRHDEI